MIDMYHMELLERTQQLQQQGDGGGFGSLSVRVNFNHDCVFVEVLRARDVIPLDSNGLSDPFVVVDILPSGVFGCQEQTTQVQKGTLNPIFDECFEL